MFSGSIVALITPMDNSGAVDSTSLKRLIEYHIASKTAAIAVVGTTGESATLSENEHVDVITLAVELAEGRIPVIAGTGSNATAQAITLTKRVHNSGISGCLVVTPYYNRPTQEGLFQHFKAIAQETDLPQILYNVPVRTGCDLLPDTVARLADIKNIVAVKEATGNLERVNQIKQLVDNENFMLLSGDDITALDFMRLGGNGVISVTANIAAREMAQLCLLAAQGDFIRAYALNQCLMPVHQCLFVETNPIPVKWACKLMGLIDADTLRLPMTPLSETARVTIEKTLKNAGLL